MDEVPTLNQYVADLEKKDEERETKRRKKDEELKAKQKAVEERRAAEAAAAAAAAAAVSLNAPTSATPAPSALAANAVITAASPTQRVPKGQSFGQGEVCLEVLKEGKIVERHVFEGPKECWIIGRALDQVAIGCQHASISRQHASITLQNGQHFLTDLGSAHGTLLEGKKLPKNTPIRLSSGATFSLGVSSRVFVFRDRRPAAMQQPTQAQWMAMQEQQRQLAMAQGKGKLDGKGGKDKQSTRFRYGSTAKGVLNDFNG